MPKKYLSLKIIAYDKNNQYYAQRSLLAYQYADAFKEYLKYVDLLTSGKFTNIARLDLDSAGRVLFSCLSLRHVVDQKNFTVNFKPF